MSWRCSPCRATTATRCCSYTTAPKAAWHSAGSWMFPSRRPRRALVPENVSRTWTAGPQRARAPTKTWAPFTRTASGNQRDQQAWCSLIPDLQTSTLSRRGSLFFHTKCVCTHIKMSLQHFPVKSQCCLAGGTSAPSSAQLAWTEECASGMWRYKLRGSRGWMCVYLLSCWKDVVPLCFPLLQTLESAMKNLKIV